MVYLWCTARFVDSSSVSLQAPGGRAEGGGRTPRFRHCTPRVRCGRCLELGGIHLDLGVPRLELGAYYLKLGDSLIGRPKFRSHNT